MFTLYSDRAWLVPGTPHVTILIPFWGQANEDETDPAFGRYDVFAASGNRSLRMGSLAECDAAIFPQDWSSVAGDEAAEERAVAFVAQAQEAGKPAVVFFWLDSSAPVELDAFVFRTSLYRSRRRPGEFALPAWSEDFLVRYLDGTLPLRRLRALPVVSFCGAAPRPPGRRARLHARLARTKWVRRTGLVQPDPEGYVRAEALDALDAHPDVETSFLRRSTFWAGVAYSDDREARRQARLEYVRNIVESDYVLCARGAGNFSYRLYEVLSCGRIPVFVDTDCVLPLEELIDWRDLCVWVDEFDVRRIGDRVAAFHASMTPAEFAERQRECRRVWERYLSPQGYFDHFHEHFA